MENPCLGPAHEGCSRHRITRTGPARCWRDATRVGLLTRHEYAVIHVNSQLHSLRPPLPDVPAVYFVSPTLANIRRIAEDLRKGLYESFHLNFVEPLPRALLEELAASVAQDGTGDVIEQASIALYMRR